MRARRRARADERLLLSLCAADEAVTGALLSSSSSLLPLPVAAADCLDLSLV